MDNIGIDVHKVESQICILTESGEIIERRLRTQRERFATVVGGRPPAKILIEASTESEWVARCLEELGHEVVVAVHLEAMTGIEEDPDISTHQRLRELQNCAVHPPLIEIETLDDLDAKTLQSRGEVLSVILGIGQLSRVLVRGVADDKRHALLRVSD